MTNTNTTANLAASTCPARPGSATPAQVAARIARIEACIARLVAGGMNAHEALTTANRTDGAA